MKLTPVQRALFIKTYNNRAANILQEVLDYGKALVETMEAHNFNCKFDMEQFAKQAVYHRLQTHHSHYTTQEELLAEAKALLNPEE